MSYYIREMQIILYMSLDISNDKNFTNLDIEDCEYFLLGQFINNTKNRDTEVHGNLIRLIYYLYSNYDTVIRKFFEELTVSFETSFNNFSDNIILYFLILETAGLVIYILFFFINFYFLYQANQYIFQNILCLFIDFTQNGDYSFNNKKDNILIRKCIRNYISLLREFTPKKLESLTSGLYKSKEIYEKEDLDEINFSEHKETGIRKSLKDKNNEGILKKKTRSKSTLKAKFFLDNLDQLENKKDTLEDTNIHDLNNSNLSKIFMKK